MPPTAIPLFMFGSVSSGSHVLRLNCMVLGLASFITAGCSGNEQFFAAIRSGNVEQVRAMCKANPFLVSVEDGWSATGLNVAVEKGNAQLVRVLVDAGSDVHHDARLTGMPLHHAAYFGKKEIVELLLAGGADVNRQPDRESSHSEGTALHAAVLGKRVQIVRLLLEHKADVNVKAKNHFEITPLHRAAEADPTSKDSLEIVRMLLERGADVNARAKFGETPLYWAKRTPAAERGHLEMVDYLVKHGAKDLGRRVPQNSADNDRR